jgi:hypothetical protein
MAPAPAPKKPTTEALVAAFYKKYPSGTQMATLTPTTKTITPTRDATVPSRPTTRPILGDKLSAISLSYRSKTTPTPDPAIDTTPEPSTDPKTDSLPEEEGEPTDEDPKVEDETLPEEELPDEELPSGGGGSSSPGSDQGSGSGSDYNYPGGGGETEGATALEPIDITAPPTTAAPAKAGGISTNTILIGVGIGFVAYLLMREKR